MHQAVKRQVLSAPFRLFSFLMFRNVAMMVAAIAAILALSVWGITHEFGIDNYGGAEATFAKSEKRKKSAVGESYRKAAVVVDTVERSIQFTNAYDEPITLFWVGDAAMCG